MKIYLSQANMTELHPRVLSLFAETLEVLIANFNDCDIVLVNAVPRFCFNMSEEEYLLFTMKHTHVSEFINANGQIMGGDE